MELNGTMTAVVAVLIFGAVLVLMVSVVVTLGSRLVKGIIQYNADNNAPRMRAPARVTGRREHLAADAQDFRLHRALYVTFEFPGAARQEFLVSEDEHGRLAEGDRGDLIYQGTRYLGFDRAVQDR